MSAAGEFAEELRRRRGGRSLRAIAEVVHSSKSTLSRLELGPALGDPSLVAALDEHYGAAGRLALHARAAGLPEPTAGRRRWSKNYPAAYSGEVYMTIMPKPVGPNGSHMRMMGRWGAWKVARMIPADRPTTWWHTKGDDGASHAFVLHFDRPVTVAFFVGVAPDDAADLNWGWVRVDE